MSGYLKWANQFIQDAKHSKTPVVGMFELTSRCNLDCKMCYVHNQNNSLCKEKELSTDEWKNIFDQAYQEGLFFATLTGGECLIRSDFRDLYLYLWNKGVKVSILSNGTMIDDNYIEFFRRYPPDYIQISLYGSDNEHYSNVTGQRMFDRAFKAIEHLKESDIDVRVAVTASRSIYEDYGNVLALCKSKRFNIANNEVFLFPNRDDPDKNDYMLSEDELVQLCLEKEQVFGRNLVAKQSVPEAGTCDHVEPLIGINCSAGNCRAFVSWEGKMYPCVNMMLGGFDILQETYHTAWQKTVELAASILNPSECVNCAYKNVCPKCPAMRISDFSTGKCNTSLCYMTREKYRLGIIEHL